MIAHYYILYKLFLSNMNENCYRGILDTLSEQFQSPQVKGRVLGIVVSLSYLYGVGHGVKCVFIGNVGIFLSLRSFFSLSFICPSVCLKKTLK